MTNETTASQPKSIENERVAFEKWAISDDGGWIESALKRNPEGNEFCYTDDDVQAEWRAWSARALLDSRAPAAQASATIQAAPEGMREIGYIEQSMAVAADFCPITTRIMWTIPHTELKTLRGNSKVYIGADAATIQEPVMVAEPVQVVVSLGDTWADSCIVCQQRGEFGIATQKGPDGCREAVESGEIYCAEHIGDAIRPTLAAPMVTDPPGVAFNREEFIRQVSVGIAEMDRDSPVDQPEMMLVTPQELQNVMRNTFESFDEDAELAGAATVKAVPSEALDAPEYILDGYYRKNGKHFDKLRGYPNDCTLDSGWVAHYVAAPLADKTGGGE